MLLAVIGISEVVAIVGVGITIIVVVASGVKIVTRIGVMVDSLRGSMDRLTAEVSKLTDRIRGVESDHAHTRERVARLEGSVKE